MKFRLWRAAAVLALAFGLVAVGTGAASAAPAAAHPARAGVTVSLDARTGQLVLPPGMHRVAATGQQDDLGGAQPAISRVNGCTDPNSYWDVRNYPPLVCFAYAGSISVAIYSVYEVDTGNNAGHFNFYYNGSYYDSGYLPKWYPVYFTNFRPEVTFIQIY
jgi:hypothetical protein